MATNNPVIPTTLVAHPIQVIGPRSTSVTVVAPTKPIKVADDANRAISGSEHPKVKCNSCAHQESKGKQKFGHAHLLSWLISLYESTI
jgi:hypothetical protein